eukprot:jgi/Hompol1/4390/HPOL_003626-RA
MIERVKTNTISTAKVSIRPTESLIHAQGAAVPSYTSRGLGGMSGAAGINILVPPAGSVPLWHAAAPTVAWETRSGHSSPSSSPQRVRSRLGGAPVSLSAASRPGNAGASTQASATPNASSRLDRLATSHHPHHQSAIVTPGDSTQPELLLDMLRYMKEELRMLGATRNDIAHFINEFRTYKPILSEIKNEYDAIIESQRESLDKLEPLKARLSVFEFQAAQELDKMRNDAMQAMAVVSLENNALLQTIEKLEKQVSTQQKQYHTLIEDMRLKEKEELTKEHPELAELRIMAQEYANFERVTEERFEAKQYELSQLESSLKIAKNELQEANSELFLAKKQLSKSIPPHEFEHLKQQIQKAHAEIRRFEDEALQMAQQRGRLEQQIKSLEAQLKKRDEEMFPDWDYIQSGFGSSIREYWNMSKGLDYNDTISLLIRELVKARTGGIRANKTAEEQKQFGETSSAKHSEGDQEPHYFVGYGLGTQVPKFLRYKGKIPNRKLTKRNCLQLIRDTWEAKALFDAAPKNKGKRTKLPDFLFMYLKKRFGSQAVIAEWGYNLMDACKKHGFQSLDCQLFYEILNDEVDEEVHHRIQMGLERLKSMFYRLDLQLHDGKARGFVPRNEVSAALKRFWPQKTDVQQEMLANPGSMVTYRWLFESEGDSVFLDVVREQENEERAAYIQGLEKQFEELSNDRVVSVNDVARILAQFDPDKRKKDLDEYLVRGFATSLEDLKAKTTIEKEAFIKNLKRGVLVYGQLDADRSETE